MTAVFQWIGQLTKPAWCECQEHGPMLAQLRAAVEIVDAHSEREDQAGAPPWARAEHDRLRSAGAAYVRLLEQHVAREADVTESALGAPPVVTLKLSGRRRTFPVIGAIRSNVAVLARAAAVREPEVVLCEHLDDHGASTNDELIALGDREISELAGLVAGDSFCSAAEARDAVVDFVVAHELAHHIMPDCGRRDAECEVRVDARAEEICRVAGLWGPVHARARDVIQSTRESRGVDVAGWLGVVPTGACSIAAVRGIEKTTPEFRAKLLRVADQIAGMNADWLARIISWETGGSFSPTARPIGSDGRPLSSAIGLLQFIKPVRDALGVTEQQLLSMSAVEQLDVVLAYYKKYAPRGVQNLCDAYYVVLAPDCRGRASDYVVYPVGSAAYNANCPNPPCGADPDADGISCGDICRAIGGIPSARVEAPCSYAAGGSSAGRGRGGGLLLALGVAAIGAVATFPLWRGYAGV